MDAQSAPTEARVEKKWDSKDVKSIIGMGQFLARMKENFRGDELARKVYVDYGISESSINKLIRISKHPILSDPKNADRLPPSWAILYELRFLPDEMLKDKLNKDELRHINKYEVWKIRGVRAKAANKISALAAIATNQNITDYVRSGMALEGDGDGEIERVASTLKIGKRTYRNVRALLLLSERPELGEADRQSVLNALEKINRTRNVRKYYDELRPLIDKIWGDSRNKKYTNESSQKRVEAYLNSIFIIGMNSQRLLDQEIPYMSIADTDRAITELAEASRVIRKTAENLRRSKHE